jgi:hypothetical protein
LPLPNELRNDDVSRLAAASSVVPGRSCGSCTLCCKLFNVPEVATTAGKWCRHCDPGKGCRIHETRPEVCRTFFCGWMVSPGLGPEWKPERSKVIVLLYVINETFWLNAYVDEGNPSAWQRPEIYKKLKQIASGNPAVGNRIRVVVRVQIGLRHIIILPDRDIDAGIVAADEELIVTAHDGFVNVQTRKRLDAGALVSASRSFSI